jgi:hypothetical protein
MAEPADDNRATVEARLIEESERVVQRLEAALAVAPDDAELRANIERIIEQARRLRQRVSDAVAQAHARDGARQPDEDAAEPGPPTGAPGPTRLPGGNTS